MSFKKKAKGFKESGQSFVEFIFLLLIIVGLSFTLIAGFNGKIGERWTEIVNIVARDNHDTPRSDINLR